MNLYRCQSADEMTRTVLSKLMELHRECGAPLRIFVPTGRSPRDVYRAMAAEKELWRRILKPLQIDEFIDPARLFFNELKEKFLSPLDLEAEGQFIDPRWSDGEMLDHVENVLKAGVHGALLGLGPDGHVGFHEPGYPATFSGGRVTLTKETKERVAGAVTDQAYTFGIGGFMKARKIILIATGAGKEKIFSSFLNSSPTAAVPATLLKTHPRLEVITDL